MAMGGNPWGAAAQSYGQDVDQLTKIQVGGMQQAAQMPLQLYDRFMSGYEQARNRSMQEQEAARRNQLADLQIQRFQAEQDEHKRLRDRELTNQAEMSKFIDQKTGEFNAPEYLKFKATQGTSGPDAIQLAEKLQVTQGNIRKSQESLEAATRKELSDRVRAAAQSSQGKLVPENLNELLVRFAAVSPNHKAIADNYLSRMGYGVRPPEQMEQAAMGIGRELVPMEKPAFHEGQMVGYDPLTGKTQASPIEGWQEPDKNKDNELAKLWKMRDDPNLTPVQRREVEGKITNITTRQPNYATVLLGQAPKTVDIETASPGDIKAANELNSTGVMPVDINRNPARSKYIRDLAAAIKPDADNAGAKAGFKADTKSLTDLQAQRDAVKAYEKMANANWEQFENEANKLSASGSPMMNRPINWLKKNATGDPQVAKVIAAGQAAHTEYSRLINNPNLKGVLSDTAREEVFRSLPKNFEDASPAMIREVGRILRADAERRGIYLDETIKEIKGRVGGGPDGPKPKSERENALAALGRATTPEQIKQIKDTYKQRNNEDL